MLFFTLTSVIPLCGISNPCEKRPFLAFFGVKHSTSPRNALWHERLEVLFTLDPIIINQAAFQDNLSLFVRQLTQL